MCCDGVGRVMYLARKSVYQVCLCVAWRMCGGESKCGDTVCFEIKCG